MTMDKPIEADPCMTLEPEDDAEFNRHVNTWIGQFRPETPSELQVIRHAASLSWELELAGRYEKACRVERIDKAVSVCVNGSRAQIERAKARASFDPSMEGERLRRHQISLRRELRRDLELFAKLRLQSAKRNPTNSAADDADSNRESGIGSRESEVQETRIPLPTPEPTSFAAGLHPEEKRPTPPARQFSFGAGLPTPLRPPTETALAPQPQLRAPADRKARRPDPERIIREIRTGLRTRRVINPAPAARLTQMLDVSASGPNRAAARGPSGSEAIREAQGGREP